MDAQNTTVSGAQAAPGARPSPLARREAIEGYLFTLPWLLHDRFGILNEFLFNTFGVIGPGWLTSPEWTKPSLILWNLWYVGGGMIIYLAGLQGVPQTLYEAAAIDGCGALGRFRHVTLP